MDNTQQHASESEAQEQMRREQRRLRKLEKAQQRAAQHSRFILTLPPLVSRLIRCAKVLSQLGPSLQRMTALQMHLAPRLAKQHCI